MTNFFPLQAKGKVQIWRKTFPKNLQDFDNVILGHSEDPQSVLWISKEPEHSKTNRIRIVYWWNAETTITHQDLWLGN